MMAYQLQVVELDAAMLVSPQIYQDEAQFEQALKAAQGKSLFQANICDVKKEQARTLHSPLFISGNDQARFDVFAGLMKAVKTMIVERERKGDEPKIILNGHVK